MSHGEKEQGNGVKKRETFFFLFKEGLRKGAMEKNIEKEIEIETEKKTEVEKKRDGKSEQEM